MSIPPLVCSTPPPLEQCEDDKEPEDFDLHYHLSQDDDENEYEYGNFTTCNNHFQSQEAKNIKNGELPHFEPNTDSSCETTLNNHIETRDRTYLEAKVISEEDRNIEDLNLKIDEQSVESNSKNIQNELEAVHSETTNIEDLQSDIPFTSKDNDQNDLKLTSPIKVNVDETIAIDSVEMPVRPENIEEFNDDPNTQGNAQVVKENMKNVLDDSETNSVSKCTFSKIDALEEADTTLAPIKIDNDLEDFDEFQFISSKTKEEVINIEADNPWGNSISDDTGFGEFAANFGEDESKLSDPTPFVAEFSNTRTVSEVQFDRSNSNDDDDEDDDFGDFDEFKTTTHTTTEIKYDEITSCPQVPVLSLQSSECEHQVIESVNKVLLSVFPYETSEPQSDFETRLETCLGETWIYLRETDVRQPYMVSWNNSLAQKTLLKALCIDSRNILFGPKWSSSMPKYAANLSVAPLQPQKQMTQGNAAQSDLINSDKTFNKNAWSDPFTSDGQESCSAESNNTAVETGPTDLDVFEATLSTKSDKIYSNTLNIQPIRQINLPDTHIFTPTDSETPRSKTIHYDIGSTPTILLPQPVPPKTMKNQPENYTPPVASSNSEIDNEYWDFQDFRGVSDTREPGQEQEVKNKDDTLGKHSSPDPKITYESQVLQPVKMETMMPTLNWPNPGEVKETFDDFADFVSNASTSNDPQEPVIQHELSALNTDQSVPTNNIHSKSKNQIDDDFDSFQSAAPKYETALDRNAVTSQSKPPKMPDIDLVFSMFDKSKSDNISLANAKPAENVIQSVDVTPHGNDLKFVSQPVSASSTPTNPVLQPTLVASTTSKQNQQNAGQILQPLSLESYSQINWPNPGIDLQDLSRFNPVETLQSFKSDVNSQSKNSSPIHNHKTISNNQTDDDIWGDFVSSKPKPQSQPKKQSTFADDDEWTDFVSSPSVNPQNGLNTISFNVHTNSNTQKTHSNKFPAKNNEVLDIPTLNYITPKTNNQKSFNDRHFQNL